MRYLAQRVKTWEWLSVDLPQFNTDGPEFALNGYGVMKVTVSPDVGYARAHDGYRMFDKGSTLIHAESGFTRWTGLVTDVDPTERGLEITITEAPGYMHGLTFTGRVWGVRDDPADLLRSIVTQTQNSDGDLGMRVTGASSRRVGTDSDDKAAAAKSAMDAAKKALDARAKPRQKKSEEIQQKQKAHRKVIRPLEKSRDAAQKNLDQLVKAKAPESDIIAAKSTLTTRNNALKAARTARDNQIKPLQDQLETLREAEEPFKKPYEDARETHRKAQEQARKDGGAWKVLAEDLPDTWKAVQDLLDEAPMDLTTHSRITDGKPSIELRLHYPAAGSARNDLVFSTDMNIVSVLEPEYADYATEVIAIGAGQGEDALRVDVATPDHRLRQNIVIDDKRVTSKAKLQAGARRTLSLLRNPWHIPEIRVRDHENCRIGAWSLGDHILVRGCAPNHGEVNHWHRIIAWQHRGDSEAVIRLERSNLL